MMVALSPLDRWLSALDNALRTLAAKPQATKPIPTLAANDSSQVDVLTESERRLSVALMRVNHAGEVCAQALYVGQALSTQSPALREKLTSAAQDETNHLAWTQERIEALNGHISWLSPFWYVGAFSLGWLAGQLPERYGLGFVMETERQVEMHLESHALKLPTADRQSQAIVRQMKLDESGHAQMAHYAGAAELPDFVKRLMRKAARVMTYLAHRI